MIGMSSFAVRMLQWAAASWGTSGCRPFPRPAIAATPVQSIGRTCPAMPAKLITAAQVIAERKTSTARHDREDNQPSGHDDRPQQAAQCSGHDDTTPVRIETMQGDTSGGGIS